MRNKPFFIINSLIILASFIIAIYCFPQLPAMVASHWGPQGMADGYSNKFWGVFLMPFISIGLFLLLAFIPAIDPKSKNILKFREKYNQFVTVMMLFLLYLFILTIVWNLGHQFNMNQFLMPAFAVLFFFVGDMIKIAEPNYTIGIRTPWTLSNETVWRKTHVLGSKVFKVSALTILIGILLPKLAVYFMLGPILFGSLFLVVYSYLEFKKENDK